VITNLENIFFTVQVPLEFEVTSGHLNKYVCAISACLWQPI